MRCQPPRPGSARWPATRLPSTARLSFACGLCASSSWRQGQCLGRNMRITGDRDPYRSHCLVRAPAFKTPHCPGSQRNQGIGVTRYLSRDRRETKTGNVKCLPCWAAALPDRTAKYRQNGDRRSGAGAERKASPCCSRGQTLETVELTPLCLH